MTLANHPIDLAKGIQWSILIHSALVIFLIVRSLFFPSTSTPYIPSLRVDLVGLPEIMKKDLDRMQIPAPEKEIVPPKDENKPKEEPKDVQLKDIKPDHTEPDANEMTLKQKKENQKKMKSALERLKSVERIREEEANTQAKVVLGNKVSQGTQLTGETRESQEAHYFDQVLQTLKTNWALPVWLARQNLSAHARVFIDNHGKVRGIRIEKSSGNPQFDDAVQKAVTDSQPFPAPPKELQSELLSNGILFGFPL